MHNIHHILSLNPWLLDGALANQNNPNDDCRNADKAVCIYRLVEQEMTEDQDNNESHRDKRVRVAHVRVLEHVKPGEQSEDVQEDTCYEEGIEQEVAYQWHHVGKLGRKAAVALRHAFL
jgi:hypothetical protein